MAAEIERKFLLDEPAERLQGCSSVTIEQGYLAISEVAEVRLRKAGERLLLTAKRGQGEVREEVEIEVGADQFGALWPLTEGQRLRKTRYLVPLGDGLDAEVDVFADGLEGLVTAEVEFESEEQSRTFQAPSWLGQEVTDEHRYANQTLALHGLPEA